MPRQGRGQGEHSGVHVLPPFGNQGALLPTPGSTFHVKTTRIAQFSLKFSKNFRLRRAFVTSFNAPCIYR